MAGVLGELSYGYDAKSRRGGNGVCPLLLCACAAGRGLNGATIDDGGGWVRFAVLHGTWILPLWDGSEQALSRPL